MNLFIYASDLAVITGHNTFKDKDEIMLKLWKTNFPKEYTHFLNKHTLKTPETDLDFIKTTSKKYTIKNMSEKIQKCKEVESTQELAKQQASLIDEFKKLPKDDFEKIKKSIVSETNTSFGSKHENKVLQKYYESTGIELLSIDSFFKKKVIQTEDFTWYLGGRIDGIHKDKSTIIEVKNRVHRLFYTLRDYEKVQIFAYMYILNIQKSVLVEGFNTQDSCVINSIPVSYDTNYWTKHIYSKLIAFIEEFELFLKDENAKLRIFS